MISEAGNYQKIFKINAGNFEARALSAFRYQARENRVYKEFLHLLDISTEKITALHQIPFLPVELFKTQKVISGKLRSDLYFESSGTTHTEKSNHYISDPALYGESIKNCFTLFYGDIRQYCFLALLPSYLERKNASLVYMCNVLMKESNHSDNGFYLRDFEKLANVLQKNAIAGQKTILFGVSFALLDFAKAHPMHLDNITIIETGGMKGQREEITREAMHEILYNAFPGASLHSEYGMTELLSQAYSQNEGKFLCPPWMKIMIRDPEDPFSMLPENRTGCINIIDLANIHSCCFIATQDLGKLYAGNSFEVLGRYDVSDIRGCNLMVE